MVALLDGGATDVEGGCLAAEKWSAFEDVCGVAAKT